VRGELFCTCTASHELNVSCLELTEQARRKFSEYEAARREMQEQALASSPLRKTVPLLMKDYQAEVAANVQRERDSLVPAIC
jgi:hypothetical protein